MVLSYIGVYLDIHLEDSTLEASCPSVDRLLLTLYLAKPAIQEEESVQEERPKDLDLPLELLDLVNAFPLGMKDCNYSKFIFAPYLPTQERAMYLAELYYQNTAWMCAPIAAIFDLFSDSFSRYDPIVQQDFVINILTPLYFAPGFTTLNTIHAHKLAVFFMAMGDGVLYDSSPDSAYLSEQYHALAQAAISIEPLLIEATSATVQALFMMFRFIYNSDRKSNEARWILTGLCGRLAQSVSFSSLDSPAFLTDAGV